MADVTLKSGVQERIRQIDPELEVVDTTDHASGDNPYYAPTKK
jgi:Fe/S biogenesis protein NfuA